jgi:rsbT co-antagonist protein RsbR
MAVFNSALQRASFAAVVYDTELRITEWNAGAEDLFGFSAAEAIGKKIPERLGSKTNALKKDGKRISCFWQEDTVEDGSVLAIVTDVTNWKTRERLLQAVLDNLPVVLWEVDTNGIFTFHDGAKGLASLGLKPGQFLGQDIYALFNGSEVVRGALAGKPTIGVDEAYGQTWQSFTLPLYDESKTIDGVAGITLDITESKKREKELSDQLAVIQEQQKTINELSIPLIETWEGVLTVPMVGVVDARRAAEIMETLLTEISERKSRYAILDLTGIQTIDTDAAAQIISLTRAIKLLGAEGIVTGIRPSMAQAMVQLGVDLTGIRTHGNLREALGFCIEQIERALRPAQFEAGDA